MNYKRVDLARRANDLEIMDDLACAGEVVYQTLRELDIINQWLGGNQVTLQAVWTLIGKRDREQISPITLVDLGCGSGEILKRIADFGRRNGIALKLVGIDANPNIVEFARRNCSGYPEMTFEAVDVLSTDFSQRSYDIIMGTLFFHHFDDPTLITLLTRLKEQVKLGLIINDIHRHWLAYHSIRLLTRLFSSSSMVKFDAPLSVRRAFVRADWVRVLTESGIATYTIQWKWAFRWKISIPAQ